MEEGEPPGKRHKVVAVAALIVVCVLAVVVSTVVLTTRDESNDHGENAVELSTLVEDVQLWQHQGSLEEDILLRHLFSSVPFNTSDDDTVAMPTNSTNATNATLFNMSQSPTLTESPLEAMSFTPVPTGPQIAKTVTSFTVLETIPHDVGAFTQGLTFDPTRSDFVYESTGLHGESDIRKVDIATGNVLMVKDTPRDVFGEGLAYYTEETTGNQVAGRLIHITWQNQKGFIFDAETLETLQDFTFSTEYNEGWGITYNPNTDQFIVTDGSNYLHFWNRDLQETARIPVVIQRSEQTPPESVFRLNEIEWDNQTQTVLSNVWQTDFVLRIDPISGRVVTEYDLSQLYTNRIPEADVLNGIAISPKNDLWVTGKRWPNMYKIVFNE